MGTTCSHPIYYYYLYPICFSQLPAHGSSRQNLQQKLCLNTRVKKSQNIWCITLIWYCLHLQTAKTVAGSSVKTQTSGMSSSQPESTSNGFNISDWKAGERCLWSHKIRQTLSFCTVIQYWLQNPHKQNTGRKLNWENWTTDVKILLTLIRWPKYQVKKRESLWTKCVYQFRVCE